MHYVVALGNPGSEYTFTRHNVGWLVLDGVARERQLGERIVAQRYSGELREGVLAGQAISVLYPTTFMNNAGAAVAKLVPRDAVSSLIVVYDDVDVALGEVKVSFGRGDGGHNGVKSVIAKLDTRDFIRVRVGISPTSLFTGKVKRPTGEKLQRYVMGQFTKRELAKVEEVGKQVATILEVIVTEGHTTAMNRYN